MTRLYAWHDSSICVTCLVTHRYYTNLSCSVDKLTSSLFLSPSLSVFLSLFLSHAFTWHATPHTGAATMSSQHLSLSLSLFLSLSLSLSLALCSSLCLSLTYSLSYSLSYPFSLSLIHSCDMTNHIQLLLLHLTSYSAVTITWHVIYSCHHDTGYTAATINMTHHIQLPLFPDTSYTAATTNMTHDIQLPLFYFTSYTAATINMTHHIQLPLFYFTSYVAATITWHVIYSCRHDTCEYTFIFIFSCHYYLTRHIKLPHSHSYTCTGWRRCLKLQVSFRKRARNYRALLQKMTYKDKASYAREITTAMELRIRAWKLITRWKTKNFLTVKCICTKLQIFLTHNKFR